MALWQAAQPSCMVFQAALGAQQSAMGFGQKEVSNKLVLAPNQREASHTEMKTEIYSVSRMRWDSFDNTTIAAAGEKENQAMKGQGSCMFSGVQFQ